MRRISLFLLVLCASAVAQTPWSTFIDSSRAIDWTSAGFSIPSYSVNCSTQPTLLTGAGNASANAASIVTALTSCDATHNVVNIPAGTYSVAGLTMPSHGKQVLRGAGPKLTIIISTSDAACEGFNGGICMISASPVYNGSAEVLPPSGTQQCLWSAGYSQGTTSITLSSCGGVPPNGQLILLDQANDSADTGGVYTCDETTPASCNYDGTGGSIGRIISGVTHSQIQVTKVTGVTSLGGGSYTVTISPGVYFTNVRTGQSPGAWWSGATTLNGLENLTIDGTANTNYTLSMYDCYQCWTKNVTYLNGARASVGIRQGGFDVVRDSYFYQAQGHASVSYNVDLELTSGNLIENNIMQQVTIPVTINNGTGNVIDYNLGIDEIAFTNFTWPAFSSHNAGNEMNLWESNNFAGIESDDAWGSPNQQTYFRNSLPGWQNGRTQGSTPIISRSYVRAYNIVGNVMGEPGYHNQYETYATSTTTGTGGANEATSIYTLGWYTDNTCGTGTATTSPFCDTLARSTLMRWGNWDVVSNAVRWNSTEAAPAAVTYVNANFTASYFNTLAQTLPSSLYYATKPSWWPSGKAWPTIGPDISTGNVGVCTGGTYAGAQAISSSQCIGGTLSTAWASHIISIPAQDCFLNVMGGHPDGSGSVLAFDAASCAVAPLTTKYSVSGSVKFSGKSQ